MNTELRELVTLRVYEGPDNIVKLLKVISQEHGLISLLRDHLTDEEKVDLIIKLHNELPSSIVKYLHVKSRNAVTCSGCGQNKDICRVCDGMFCGKDCQKNGGMEFLSFDLEKTPPIIKMCNYCYLNRDWGSKIDHCLDCKMLINGDTVICASHLKEICTIKEALFCGMCCKSFEEYGLYKMHVNNEHSSSR